MMRLILIGPPGSGKGTQAKLLSERLGLLHFSTGDILREAVEKGSAEGLLAKPYLDNGQLVPSEIVNDIVNTRFRGDDKPLKFVMDGYPRTLAQAQAFDAVLQEQSLTLHAVLALHVKDEEIVRRISNRLTCLNPECKATYHTQYRPPKTTGRCDLCSQLLHQRDDDKVETVRKRLVVFHNHYDEMMQYYQRRGLLVEVPGGGHIETVHAAIVQSLKGKAPREARSLI